MPSLADAVRLRFRALTEPPATLARALAQTLARRATSGPLVRGWSLRDETFLAFMRLQWQSLRDRPAAYTRAYLDALPVSTAATRRVRQHAARLGGVLGTWLVPPDARADTALVYFHGGAFVYGNLRTHGDVAARLALRSRLRTFLPLYRLAPEHPFPAAADDALAVVASLRAFTPHVVLAGDSAGGALALHVGLELARTKQPAPPAIVAFSPWLDLACTSDSYARFAAIDFVSGDALAAQGRAYAGARAASDPALSLLHADPRGLGPTLVQVGELEVMHDEAQAFVAAARRARVDVTLDVLPLMPHAATNLAAYLGEADRAVTRASDFLREHLP